MSGATTPLWELERPEPEPLFRNALIRLLGWRGLLLQSDPPTWDRWQWVRRHLQGRSRGRLLDAGCGSGGFVLAAAAHGHRAIGLSFDDAANRMARRRAALLREPNVDFRTTDLRQLDRLSGELGRFDLIVCLETIEHVVDDRGLVRSLAGLLEPGGMLLVSTPSLAHRALVGEHLSAAEDGGHVRWGYDAAGLDAVLREAGLTTVAIDYLSGVWCQTITNLARRLTPLVGERVAWMLTAPLRLGLPLDRAISQWLGHPWLAIAAVATKP